MSMPFALPSWLPWWVPLLVLVPAILYALLFLLMPFSVIGVKGRLDVIEARLDELQGEIRTLALRLGEPVQARYRPDEDAYDLPPVPPAPMTRGGYVGPSYTPPPPPVAPRATYASPANPPAPSYAPPPPNTIARPPVPPAPQPDPYGYDDRTDERLARPNRATRERDRDPPPRPPRMEPRF